MSQSTVLGARLPVIPWLDVKLLSCGTLSKVFLQFTPGKRSPSVCFVGVGEGARVEPTWSPQGELGRPGAF